jgi:hypothetical protein
VRSHLPPAYQDILDFSYYSGWRRREVTELTWEEVDLAGRVVRLSPSHSKTKAGRLLPVSEPLRLVLEPRTKRRKQKDLLVFKRDGGHGSTMENGLASRLSSCWRARPSVSRLSSDRRPEPDTCGCAGTRGCSLGTRHGLCSTATTSLTSANWQQRVTALQSTFPQFARRFDGRSREGQRIPYQGGFGRCPHADGFDCPRTEHFHHGLLSAGAQAVR